MLGALAYGLGSVYSIMSMPKFSFVIKMIIVAILIVISQLVIDFETGTFKKIYILYYIGLLAIMSSSIASYSFVMKKLMKI